MATDLLDSLRSRIGADHLITSCGGRGCRVDMAGVPGPYLIVDADKAFPAHRLGAPAATACSSCSARRPADWSAHPSNSRAAA